MQPLPLRDAIAEHGQIVICVNGPGEISGWLHPFVTEFRRRHPFVRVCVSLVPCTFSSGGEKAVVAGIPGVDAICDTRETMALILRGRMPRGFESSGPGVVLHMGGEVFLSFAVAWRLGRPGLAYVEAPFFGRTQFDKVFYTGLKDVPPACLESPESIVGEMMVDAAHLRTRIATAEPNGRVTVGLYPGSRDYLVKYMLPFFATVADRVGTAIPDIDWVLVKSNFLSLDYLADLPSVDDGRPLEGHNPRFETSAGRPCLVTEGGTRINIIDPGTAAGRVDIALTIPGTVTAELAILGIPMLVTLPTYWGETAPLPGLAGHLGRIPLVGHLVKRAAALLFLRNLDFVSHPNRRAGRHIVPELIGRLTADEVAGALTDMIASDRDNVAKDLRSVMGTPGAACRLVEGLAPYYHTMPGVRP